MAESSAELTPPKPRSPPKYPDFSGRRRLDLEVQNLNREVGFLQQEELQSLEGLQPVSACCKQVNEYVGKNPDPLMPVIKKKHGSCYICRWIGSKACCTCSWIFCCTYCTGCSNKPDCCTYCTSLKNLFCCSCKCGCLRCDRKISCCRLPCNCRTKEGSCCSLFRCCCCCSWNLLCCGLPRCCGCKESSCCKNPCRCFVTPCSCPEYSCGCVFDCPKCTGVKLCPKCSKPCCVTGCLC